MGKRPATPLLELINVGKSFFGVRALHGIQLQVDAGRVHVICGENGAGKSTLVKIINGVYQPDEGEIRVNGKTEHINSPIRAHQLKISMIFQELNYIPENTVEQHVFLGCEPTGVFGNIDWKTVRRRTIELLKAEGLPYSPTAKLKDLSVSDIQMIEIMKAVSTESNVILMDEPTSAITNREVDRLLKKIGELRSRGVGIIYISHKMDEIFRIADDITVLRDGRHISTQPADQLTIDEVIRLMVGRQIADIYPPPREANFGPVALTVKNLTRNGYFDGIHFDIRQGEIVGMAGLMGAGRTEVARAIFGLDPYDEGEVNVNGAPLRRHHVGAAIESGIAMLSEDRRRFGIIPLLDIRDNVMIGNWEKVIFNSFRHHDIEDKLVGDACKGLKVKTESLSTLIKNLSGGNQQKVILGRWILREPDVLILDEPTRGIDVGSKSEIYRLMHQLAEQGKAILCISSELPELIGVCDRIIVIAAGQQMTELSRPEFSQEAIMKAATSA